MGQRFTGPEVRHSEAEASADPPAPGAAPFSSVVGEQASSKIKSLQVTFCGFRD